MRLVRQITYEAKDDVEALSIAKDRLGRDAIILSSRSEMRGGVLGFFRHKALVVTAGLLEEERSSERPRESREDSSERIMAFQRLLEVKHAVKEAFSNVPEGFSKGEEPSKREVSLPGYSGEVPRKQENQPSSGVEGVSFAFSTMARQLAAKEGALSSVQGKDPQEYQKIKGEIEEIRGILHTLLARFPEEGMEKPASLAPVSMGAPAAEPERGGPFYSFRNSGDSGDFLLESLLAQDLDAPRARQLVEEFRGSQMEVPFSRWLGSRIAVKGKKTLEALGGHRVLFVGPTGVGKTTTIAKLAAILSLWEKKSVLLLTADTYRIAAVEQLKMYARILGVPFRVLQTPQDAPEILKEYEDVDVVLVDTAGRCQKDSGKMEELEVLYRFLEPDVVHLVLAANMKNRDMEDVLERMTVPLSGLVFTKLDETLSFGALLGILLRTELPLSFLTAGQNVPNDIDVADPLAFAQLFAGGDKHVSPS